MTDDIPSPKEARAMSYAGEIAALREKCARLESLVADLQARNENLRRIMTHRPTVTYWAQLEDENKRLRAALLMGPKE